MAKANIKGLSDLLVQESYVSAEDISKAEAYAKENDSSVLDYLLAEGVITHNLLGQAMAEYFNVPYADLRANLPNAEQVLLLSEEFARKYNVVIFKNSEKEVVLATDNPKDKDLLQELKKIFKNKNVILAYAFAEDLEEVFIYYRKALKTRFAEIIENQERIAPEIIDEIFRDALTFKASDIHFEPQEKEVVIRFRIDGLLREAGRIPKDYYQNILNRIKVQAHLRIDEHFSAQDGALRHLEGEKVVDMRVSVIPAMDGEKVTIRVLSAYVEGFGLKDLGMSEADHARFVEAGRKPFGMILVVGPTGSGKSTTLYALLKLLNKPDINITTIEDPVEYRLVGVNQIQVNSSTNLSFAQGLRSIVRQDPDIVLVGEIRDDETAEVAVNAALTGHLLLSTFHSNDAATAIPRLLDMGTEPFLLASTLELIIAQRLARKICDHCRASYSADIKNLSNILPGAGEYFDKDKITLYRGKGCDHCNDTGYKGRTALFELITVSKEIKELALKNPSSQAIWDLAKSQGSTSMFEDGLEKVENGVTTVDELLRVATPS